MGGYDGVMGEIPQVGRVLLASVRGDVTTAETAARELGPDARLIPEAASFHGVQGFVQQAIGDHDVLDPLARDALRDDTYRVLMTRAQVLADLAALAIVLDRAGIDFLVVKGPVLGELLYPEPQLRAYSDLDLVVRPEQLPAAVAVLEDHGHELLDQNWELLRRVRPGEVHLAAPCGTVIDLHWHLLNSPQLRAECPIVIDELFDRARTVELGGVEVRTLDVIDTLVFVAFHACASGGDRLIWVEDVARCADLDDLDWGRVEERATEWRFRMAVALMLRRSRRLRPQHAPNGPQCFGERTAYVSLDRLVTGLWPIETSRGLRSPARLVARAARGGGRSSAVELARHGRRWLREGAPRGEPNGIERDEASPYSPLYPSGGDAGRSAFLDAVATRRL